MYFNLAHIIPNPSGTFSLAGSVPFHPRTMRLMRLSERSKESRAAVMGGRVGTWRGAQYSWRGRAFKTREAAARAVRLAGGTLAP